MAVGKNKKKPKKGAKKKLVDNFTKKEWFTVRAPSSFQVPTFGRTVVNKTAGKKLASDSLMGRVFAVSLADLNKDEEQAYRVLQFVVEDVQGSKCLTNYHGLRFTTDKLKSLVRKWQTLIEAVVEVKTTDGYTARLFALAFTKKRPQQIKKTSYAQSAQIKAIRRKIGEIIQREAANCDLKQLFDKLIPEVFGRHIESETQGIYPLQNCLIRKVKITKRPKVDLAKLAELHSETAPVVAAAAPVEAPKEDTGAPVKA